MIRHDETIRVSRLEALTDGIFGVAMTLLVLDINVPASVPAHDEAALWHAVTHLHGALLAYAMSFFLLGLRWLNSQRMLNHGSSPDAAMRGAYWLLVYLFLVTVVPFTTSMIGRFPGQFLPILLFAVNNGLIALASVRIVLLHPPELRHPRWLGKVAGMLLLLVTGIVSVVIGLFDPALALWAYVLNALGGPLEHAIEGRRAGKG